MSIRTCEFCIVLAATAETEASGVPTVVLSSFLASSSLLEWVRATAGYRGLRKEVSSGPCLHKGTQRVHGRLRKMRWPMSTQPRVPSHPLINPFADEIILVDVNDPHWKHRDRSTSLLVVENVMGFVLPRRWKLDGCSQK